MTELARKITAPAYRLTPADIFNLLTGHWHLERTIPGQATIEGHATFTPQTTDTTLYTERVTTRTTTGATLTGTATYLFSQRPDGDLDIHLPATGALFHTLHFTRTPTGDLEAHATHLCAADTYTSTYRLLSPDHLTIEHTVRGPRKNYTPKTTLTRTETEA